MSLARQLARALQELDAIGARSALVGGLAVSALTEPRFTRDVDLAVAVQSDAEAEGIVHALRGAGYRVAATIEQTGVGRLATARLVPPAGSEDGRVLDLLFASSGIEPEVVDEAEGLIILGDVRAPTARAGHLVAMKLLSTVPRRPQDGLDLAALRPLLDSPEELDRARRSVRAIQERGFARGRDLVVALDAYLLPARE